MKKNYILIILSFLISTGITPLFAQEADQNQLLVTMETTIDIENHYDITYTVYYYHYNQEIAVGDDAVALYFDYGNGKGKQEIYMPNGKWGSFTDEVGIDATIKIYGSKTAIIGIDISQDPRECVSYLDVSNNEAMTFLDCTHNSLTSLDLTAQTELTYLGIGSNLFIELPDLTQNVKLKTLNLRYNYSIQDTPLDFSFLSDLEDLNLTQNKFSSVDVTQNTKLKVFSMEMAPIGNIDLSNCPDLEELRIETAYLSSLDVSNNPKLTKLICSGTPSLGKGKLTSLDVSHLTELTWLACYHNQLTDLDVSNSPKLETLLCYSNKIAELNVSNNPNLGWISAYDNQLESLDVSNASNLNTLSLRKNRFTIETLPRMTHLLSYDFDNQAYLNISEDLIQDGYIVDLSSQYLVDFGGSAPSETNYEWRVGTPPVGYKILTEGVDYTIKQGITNFLENPNDEVFCKMQNPYFPGATFHTNPIVITGNSIEYTNIDEIFVSGGKGFINIITSEQATIHVYSTTGSLIKTSVVDAGANQLSIDTSGVYIVKVINNHSQSTHKVIVK